MRPRGDAVRASQALADALGEGWVPTPRQNFGHWWITEASFGPLSVQEVRMRDGQVLYEAQANRMAPLDESPTGALVKLRDVLVDVLNRSNAAEGGEESK